MPDEFDIEAATRIARLAPVQPLQAQPLPAIPIEDEFDIEARERITKLQEPAPQLPQPPMIRIPKPLDEFDERARIRIRALDLQPEQKVTQIFQPDAGSNLLKEMWTVASWPGKEARKGWHMILKKVPDPQTKSAYLNFMLGLPKTTLDIGTEFASSFLDPEVVLLTGAGKAVGKFARSPAGKSAMTALRGKTPDWIKRPFTYRFGQPAEYVDLAEARISKIHEGMRRAQEAGVELTAGLSKHEQWQLGELMHGRGWDKVYSGDLAAKATKARGIIDDLSDALVEEGTKSGFINKNLATTIKTNKGKYLPRLFRIFEDKSILKKIRDKEITFGQALGEEVGLGAKLTKLGLDENQISAFHRLDPEGKTALLKHLGVKKIPVGIVPKIKPAKLKIDFLKKKKDLSEDYRKALGEIETPGMPAAKAIMQMTHTVETAKLFNSIAKNPNWASPAYKEGWVMLEGKKAFGNLSGKWVHPEIARDLNDITRIPGTAEKMWGKALGAWKFGKVVLNPATHSRNLMSNSILLDLSGIDHIEQMRLLPRALKELSKGKGSRYYNEAISPEADLLGHEFIGGEVKTLMSQFGPEDASEHILPKLFKLLTVKPARGMAKLYQAEEQWFKLAKFMSGREKGLSIKEAAREAEKWIFNYEKIAPLTRTLRKMPLGSPFITFSAKALPRAIETGLKNPVRLYKYEMLKNSFNTIAQRELGLSDTEMSTIKKNARGQFILLPWRDMNDLPQTLDLSYILPWGDIGETGAMHGLPPAFSIPGGPLVPPAIELGANVNIYRKSLGGDPDIWKETDLPMEKFQKKIDHLYKGWMPSFAPPIPGLTPGGYSAHKLISSIHAAGMLPEPIAEAVQARKSDYFGRIRSIPTVIMDVIFGLKTFPQDPELLERFDVLEVRKHKADIIKSVKRSMRDQGLSEDTQERAVEMAIRKIDILLDAFEDTGE